MNSIQNARYKAYSLALAHLKENEAITKGVPAFETAYLAAKQTLDAIAGAGNLQQQNRLAITAGKQQYREELANQAHTIAAAIVTYASGKNDQQLKEAMNFNRSELFHSTDRELGAYAANILASAKVLAGELKGYGITDEALSSYTAKVEQYLVAANEPRNTQADRVQAGQLIKEGLNTLKDQLKNQLDKLMLQYKFSHPDFYNQYRIKRSVINPGQRKTRLEGGVTDIITRKALSDVEVIVKDTPFLTSTLSDGSYMLQAPLLTEAEIMYKKEGYVPVSVKVEIKRGQRTHQDVALKPA